MLEVRSPGYHKILLPHFTHKNKFPRSYKCLGTKLGIKSRDRMLVLRVNLRLLGDQDISIKMLISFNSCFNYLKQVEFKDCRSRH